MNDTDITIDDDLKSQILKELREFSHQFAPKQPGDITINDLAEDRGLRYRSAHDIMMRIAKDHPDRFELVKVERDHSNGGYLWMWALRKKGING